MRKIGWAALGIALIACGAYAGGRTLTAVTVGASSTQAIATSVGPRLFLSIDNESATATIACSFGGTAALNTAGSYTILPQATRTWTGTANSSLLGSAVNCIASAGSTPATFETAP